jgi:hypothetical protein
VKKYDWRIKNMLNISWFRKGGDLKTLIESEKRRFSETSIDEVMELDNLWRISN